MWSEPAGRWPFEDLHAAEHALLAVRTQAESGGQEGEEQFGLFGGSATGVGVDLGLAERIAARGEEPRSASIGEDAVVADADEALREDVEQEAARELL
jgi:hypothetical protein